MASIERTAYPRFRHEPTARELQDLFTPAQDEVDFARSLVRSSDEHLFAAVLLLKCLQYLGYFPELSEIPKAVVNHVRICLRLTVGRDTGLQSDPHNAPSPDRDPRPPATETPAQP